MLNETIVFGAQWSEKVHIQSDTLTIFHCIFVLSGCIYSELFGRAVYSGEILIIAPQCQADLVWDKDIKAIVITVSSKSILEYFGFPSICYLSSKSIIINRNQYSAHMLYSSLDCLAKQHDISKGKLDQAVEKQWVNLLLSQLTDYLHPASLKIPLILPGQLRLVVDWIHAYIKEPISVNDLLTLAECSRRTLESNLKTYLQTTPAHFILQQKLIMVREELLKNTDAKVGDVAYSYGFSHLSHFSKYYFRAFSELPSETLRARK